VKQAVLGAALLLFGIVLVSVGVLPVADALAVAQRVWPVLLFVIAITVVTDLAAEAGLFTAIAERAARLGRGRTWVLWLLVVALAVACTIFLSLDTTAVLLTPVVILLARHIDVPPLPFALTTVWLANTASLLLPVSNLTNLLAQHHLAGLGVSGFAALMAASAVVAVVVPCLVIFAIYRRQLRTRFVSADSSTVSDRLLFRVSAIVVAVLVPLLVSGLPVWIPTCAAALVLIGFFVVRKRSVLRFGLLPWRIVLLASGLFLVVEAAHSLGLSAALSALAGRGEDAVSLLRLTTTGALGSNLVDNLPAYLALEPVAADSPRRLAALLIGTNAGPLVTPWASLATLLWHERLVALEVEFSWKRYMLLGLIVVPLTIVPACLALLL
jgi:arsenical pump membrane protein